MAWNNDTDCQFVHNVNLSDKCDFVRNNSDCQDSDGFVNYVEVLYCEFGLEKAYGAIAVFALWIFVLFVALAISTDDYFCPNLASISKTLRLPQNIAGVTILAFGNGAPDVFSALASVQQQRPELLLGALLGAGVFVTTAVTGAICLSKPFKVMERPFLRDVTFYLAAGFWAFCIFYRQEIYLSDALGFLSLYVIYILVVIFGRIIHQRMRNNARNRDDPDGAAILDEDDVLDDDTDTLFVPKTMIADSNFRSWVDPATLSTTSSEILPDTPDGTMMIPNSLADIPDPVPVSVVPSKWTHLFTQLNPFYSWNNTKLYQRLWMIIKAPVVVPLTLTIPVHDIEDTENNEGWCQLLHALQLIFASQFMAFAFTYDLTIEVFNCQVWQLTLMISLILVVLLLVTSSTETAPIYQPVFAFVGFIVAVGWIYLIANEIVSILKALGVFWNISDAILGLTVLAWGNSIADLIADVAIAKQGYPRMGFSACFGGPLFNLLIGIGLPFTIAILKNGGQPLKIQYNFMVVVLSASLGVALLVNFILMPLTKFEAKRYHGFILVALYFALLTFSIVAEFSFQ